MKLFITAFIFLLCLSSFSQTLHKKSTKLPIALSSLNFSDLKSELSTSSYFKEYLKKYTLSIDGIEIMRQGYEGNLFINTKNMNKNFSFLEIPSVSLEKELRNVMLKTPVAINARGFTL